LGAGSILTQITVDACIKSDLFKSCLSRLTAFQALALATYTGYWLVLICY